MKKSEVIKFFGGVCKTAEALGIRHPSVSGWPEIIPEKQAMRLDHLTKGKLKYNSKTYQKNSDV